MNYNRFGHLACAILFMVFTINNLAWFIINSCLHFHGWSIINWICVCLSCLLSSLYLYWYLNPNEKP